MICPNCKKEISDDSKFCPFCGAPTAQEKEPTIEIEQEGESKTATAKPEAETSKAETSTEEAPKTENEPKSSPQQPVTKGIVCPCCGSDNLSIERFNWWGGLVGAAIANRMKCNDCGCKFRIKR